MMMYAHTNKQHDSNPNKKHQNQKFKKMLEYSCIYNITYIDCN